MKSHRRLWDLILPPAALAGAYYAGCLVGFAARYPSSGISFFWPPTALLTAALLLTARRMWPSLLAAAFVGHALAHAQNGVPAAAWPVQFLGNATQAVLSAFILRVYTTGVHLFRDLRTIMTFILGGCVVAPAAASLIPAYAYVHLGWAPDFFQAWRARAVSNSVASLTLVPSLILMWQHLWPRPSGIPRRLGEYALLLLGMFGVHAAAGYIERTDILGLLAVLYAPVPFLLWATTRFGGAGLSVALLWTTLLTISGALAGHGPLAANPGADTVIAIQLFLIATSVPMMVIAGLLQQNHAEHMALLEVERQNSAILGAHPDLMFVQTRSGVYLQHHTRNQADLLLPPESFLGKHMRDVLPVDVANQFALAFESVTFDESTNVEYTLDVNDERRRYEARVIGLDGERVLSVVRDITDRWRSESALREVQQRYALATAAGGIAVWDVDVASGTVCVEGALHKSLGYQDHDIGPNLTDWERLIVPSDLDDIRARLRSYTGSAASSFEAEFRMIHRDGSVRWFVSTGAAAERADGSPARIIGTIADITERKAASLALKEANDVMIRMGVERAHEMFTTRPMQKSVLNLNAAIRNVVEIAGGRLRERGVLLELRLHEELPVVLGDAVQIQQVLLNLVRNAVEAMDVTTGPRVLRVSSRPYRYGAIVSVRDTGCGLEPETVRRVFEPFYTTKTSGAGMGLTTSRSVIKSHGGSLWGVANVDQGATFRFKIPVPDVDDTVGKVRPEPRKVLIVDDHDELRKSIVRLVRGWGHEVAVAVDGPGALSVAKTFQPDCAILDLSLGGMTGIDLARRLVQTSLPKRPYLIALTAFREPETRDACLAAGFDAYLIKTGDLHELEQLLASANEHQSGSSSC